MMTQKRVLFKGGVVLTMDPELRDLPRGDVLVQGTVSSLLVRICRLMKQRSLTRPARSSCRASLNAHQHAWLGLVRGLMPNVGKIDDYFAAIPFAIGRYYRPREMYNSTRTTSSTIAVGPQFLATVLTRGYAGSRADSLGGRQTMLRGGIVCAGACLIYMLSGAFSSAPFSALMVLLVGRVIAGFGESQLVTGTATWIVATAGPQRAGKALSWVGMSMYASVAASAPPGMELFQRGGFGCSGVVAVSLSVNEISPAVPAAIFPFS